MALDATRTLLGAVWLAAALGASAGDPPASAPAAASNRAGAPALATAPVTSSGAADLSGFDGVVQALRQTVVAAQVPGAVVALDVKAGDTVRAGQVLLRLDARAAEQTAAAQLAAAGAARTQSGFYVVKAPYDGVVSDVAVVLGDMAMPGRPLLTLHDPRLLRVSIAVPQMVAARLAPGQPLQVELPGLPAGRITPVKTQLLPAVDPATHTLELRLDLPSDVRGAAPGMFARAWLPVAAAADARLYVPARAVVRRAELTAVYVIGSEGRPLLRQVRLGRAQGDLVEVLAGVSAGEQVVLEPQAAARLP